MSKPIQGKEKKKVYSVSLEPRLAEKVKKKFKHNLSSGLTEIVEEYFKKGVKK